MVKTIIKKRPPYDFFLEELGDFVTAIKPMFGAYGIYHNEKILMILRKKEKFDNDTGMWVGVVTEHIASLKKSIPELRDLEMFGTAPTAWQVVGEDLENFEEICIGRTPKARLKKASK